MDKQIYGQGHTRIIPNQLIADKISTEIFDRKLDESIIPNIALADADFEGQLLCGSKVTFLRRDTIDPTLFQDVQGNEDPETDVITLCAQEVEICGSKDFQIKLSVHQLKQLECENLDNVYFDTVDRTISDTVDLIWDQSHLATMLMMAARENTGNNALGLVDLGSAANPIVIPKDRMAGAAKLEEVFSNLQFVLTTRNAMNYNGDVALVLPTLVANRAAPIFRDLNVCCGEDNIRIKGQLPKTIYGFDSFMTNRQVLSVMYGGRRIFYIIAADKYASGFVSDFYNFKWWEDKRDWFLVGTEVHGSYVTYPEHIAIAAITFEQ